VQDHLRLAQNEIRLSRAVLDQALFDATLAPQNGEEVEAKREAIEWFEKEDDDFDAVCFLAQLDPAVILRIYHHRKDKP
jgi:hypothetical protein